MPRLVSAARQHNGSSARHQLLVTVERLPKPDLSSFQKTQPPPASELEAYRIVNDVALRAEILSSGLGEIVQRPGPGNWKKNAPPPFILRIYPSFDAPASSLKRSAPAVRTGILRDAGAIPAAVLHDLRSKWERYYADTRPDRQKEHERKAESADPSVISARAQELIAAAARGGQRLTTREAMLEAADEITSDFETAMRRRYGDIVVDIFGIPAR
jgi:hypothetical protein